MARLSQQQIAALKRQLAAGQMPQGVAALPMGMQPPGSVDLGGVVPNVQGQHPDMVSREKMNPIAPEDAGIAQVRSMSNCNIPEESGKLRDLLDKVLQLDTTKMDEKDVKEMDSTLSDCILIGITANRHCRENTSKRVAVAFSKDPKLSSLHKDFIEKEAEVLAIKEQFKKARQEALDLLEERWSVACKSHGLNPKTKFYQIDEDQGLIYEVELRCDKCKGSKRIRTSRVRAETLIEKYTKELKENSND